MSKSTAVSKKIAKQPLAKIVQLTPKVRSGGLDPSAVLVNNPSKVARSPENAQRHLDWNGKTVRQVLESRQGDSRDINYDLSKGFMTLKA
jgi:hypothetical protein